MTIPCCTHAALQLWLAMLTFLYVDFLDTTGTLFSMANFMNNFIPGACALPRLLLPSLWTSDCTAAPQCSLCTVVADTRWRCCSAVFPAQHHTAGFKACAAQAPAALPRSLLEVRQHRPWDQGPHSFDSRIVSCHQLPAAPLDCDE